MMMSRGPLGETMKEDEHRTGIVISATSDIGTAIARRWIR